MSQYIELIDKYVIEQRKASEMSKYGSDMNPPNYIWADNTGELVRCGDCRRWHGTFVEFDCPWDTEYNDMPTEHDYCSKGVRRYGTKN